MKKTFKFYTICWALLLVLFNLITAIITDWFAPARVGTSYWIGFVFINLSFIGQLVCSWAAMRGDSLKKTFYNLRLFTLSYIGLLSNFVVGMFCMLIPPMPYWVGAILCPTILVINVIALLKATAVIELVSDVDKKVATATAFIYEMRDESEALIMRAKTEEAKSECKKVRDAFKYSDPMSNNALITIEVEIKTSFDAFKNAIKENNVDAALSASDDLMALISQRNNRCKTLK